MTHDEMLSILDAPVVNFLEDFHKYRGIVRAVLELHNPDDHTAVQCRGCSSYWPCPTTKVIQEKIK
jgi:hypothetical protein